jgi:hypothetical protein
MAHLTATDRRRSLRRRADEKLHKLRELLRARDLLKKNGRLEHAANLTDTIQQFLRRDFSRRFSNLEV